MNLVKNKTTGIGSLPHQSIESAVQFSLKHTLPFLPQLTFFNENMIEQAVSSDIIKSHRALEHFKEKLLEYGINEFKIQIAGPSTCNTNAKIILNTIEKFLDYFSKYNLRPTVFIDEPIFKPESLEFQAILQFLKKQNILTGIHTCNYFNWDNIHFLDLINYFSFDSSISHLPPLNKNTDQLIIGISPKLNNDHFKNYKSNFYSYSCGMANISELECENVLKYLEVLK